MTNILLSGAGAPAAIGAIKSLQKANFKGKIVAVDSNKLSAGFYMADKGITIPKLTEPNHWKELKKIIEEEKIDLILPSNGFDIQRFSQKKEELESLGVTVFMSDYEPLMNCIDKWKFYETNKEQFPLPKTSLKHEEITFPLFAKPRFGKGSVGAMLCKNSHDIKQLDPEKEYIYQEYLPGEEYTIDVICDLQGKALIAVPRIRLEVKAGISVKGQIIENNEISTLCKELAESMKLIGPLCMQIMTDTSGKYKFIEINPRLGGGTYFATLAGVNIPKILVDLHEGKEIQLKKPKCITVLRYFEEIIAEK